MILAAHEEVCARSPALPPSSPRGRRVVRLSHAARAHSRSSRSVGLQVAHGFSVLEERHLFARHGVAQRRPGEPGTSPQPAPSSISCPRRHGANPTPRGVYPAPAARAGDFTRSNGHEQSARDYLPRAARVRRLLRGGCVGRAARLRRHCRDLPALAEDAVIEPVGVEPPAGQPAKQANVHGARPVCTFTPKTFGAFLPVERVGRP